MKRKIENLKNMEFEVLIIGGGILGLFIAWDAALRGLSVALIDKGDFGGETSSNSLRIIHGGLRHIQSLDLRVASRFKREQSIFMNLAPDLVKPMPVIIPLYNKSSLIKYPLDIALRTYELLGTGLKSPYNGVIKKFTHKVLTRDECINMLPNINKEKLSGGFLFTDCQITNSERFSMLIASLACIQGASLANYVGATELITKGGRVIGARARDTITGEEFEIRSKYTVNASGPWINSLLPNKVKESSRYSSGNLKAFNIAVSRDLTKGYVLGLKSKIDDPYLQTLFSRSSRYLFITPWRGKSLIGTQYIEADTGPDNINITRDEISAFLENINNYYPSAKLSYKDVEYIYRGYVPTYPLGEGQDRIGIKTQVYDHEKKEGISGILSVRGSKYTDARIVAEECVDLILKKNGKKYTPSLTAVADAHSNSYSLSENGLEVESSETTSISSLVINAINNEMALKLSDVVFRRLDLNYYDIKQNLEQYSGIMAKELNWDEDRIKSERREVISRLSLPN